jgi:hypothetical protein
MTSGTATTVGSGKGDVREGQLTRAGLMLGVIVVVAPVRVMATDLVVAAHA